MPLTIQSYISVLLESTNVPEPRPCLLPKTLLKPKSPTEANSSNADRSRLARDAVILAQAPCAHIVYTLGIFRPQSTYT